ERGHQQVNLGREVPVQRTERHLGALGDGPHLHGVITALGGERERRVQDPLAPFTLRGRTDVGLGRGCRLGSGTRSRRWHWGPLVLFRPTISVPRPRRNMRDRSWACTDETCSTSSETGEVTVPVATTRQRRWTSA